MPEVFPSDLDVGGHDLARCYVCGHLRTSHLENRCSAPVSTVPDVESWHRDRCSCSGYYPDEGVGRWTLDGKRVN
jgi:hypothetical protein